MIRLNTYLHRDRHHRPWHLLFCDTSSVDRFFFAEWCFQVPHHNLPATKQTLLGNYSLTQRKCLWRRLFVDCTLVTDADCCFSLWPTEAICNFFSFWQFNFLCNTEIMPIAWLKSPVVSAQWLSSFSSRYCDFALVSTRHTSTCFLHSQKHTFITTIYIL